jgi:hypothetical protein
MSMTLKRTLAILLAAVVVGCSANTPVDQPEPVDDPGRIAKLENAFRSSEVSAADRIRIATELVRLGVPNAEYKAFLLNELDRALAEEQKAAEEWLNQQKDVRPPAAARMKSGMARPSGVVPAKNTVQSIPAEFTARTAKIGDVSEREEDASFLNSIVASSMSIGPADTDIRDRLRTAVNGQNVLFAVEAALGLARVKDKEAIPMIEAAAYRFEEDFLFARALVYFDDRTADAIAKKLLKNQKLFDELHETARLRQYDPYFRK